MKKFDAEAFFQISRNLELMSFALVHYTDAEYYEVVNRGTKLGLGKLRDDLLKIEAAHSLKLLDRMATALTPPVRFTREESIDKLGELSDRIKDELSSIEFVHIDAGLREFYDPPSPLFGADVAGKFPVISYDIAEAGKCLALERSTASVFHLIRCLEAGIRAIARCLGIADPTRAADRTWGNILRTVKGEIDKRWPSALVRTGGDDELFDNAYAALAGMQNPYRNSTMHLDQIYTLEDARHIFEVVKGFMRKIASRMDENGDPKAP
jgi:hypothetical protein